LFATHTWIEDLDGDSWDNALRYESSSVPQIPQLNAVAMRESSAGGSARYVGIYPPDPDHGIWSAWGDDPPQPTSPADVQSITLQNGGQLVLNHGAVSHLVGDLNGEIAPWDLRWMTHDGA
jgi:hypothetical protein